MGRQIRIFDTIGQLAAYFSSFLELRIGSSPAGRDFSWVLPGGSTPERIFGEVASSCRDNIEWGRVRVFWGDERCVGPADSESNYRMARLSLLDHIPLKSSNVFRIHGEDDPEAEAARYSDCFATHVESEGGVPRADLVMLGIGDDGHTASVFPANAVLFQSEKLFEVSEHPVSKQKRITATGKVINNAKTVIILACGESKSEIVARVIGRENGWLSLPASLVEPLSGDLVWLLDRKSANKLKDH